MVKVFLPEPAHHLIGPLLARHVSDYSKSLFLFKNVNFCHESLNLAVVLLMFMCL